MKEAELSAREEEVLLHFTDGLTYAQIGRRMGISSSTVDTYLRRIRGKTGVSVAADLFRLGTCIRERRSKR